MQEITGTLIWYYYICPREVWLMAHELNPNQEDFLHSSWKPTIQPPKEANNSANM